jgi:hypothetical protein
MPDSIAVSLSIGGDRSAGTFNPSAKAIVAIKMPNRLATTFTVDYTKQDSLRLHVDGEFSLDVAGGTLDLAGGGSVDLLKRGASVSGSMEWIFDKRVSVKAVTSYDVKDGLSAAATLTLTF